MARSVLAMASSSTTRCGRLLSSEIALGTAFGSMPGGSFWEAPRVGGLSFIGEGASAVDADMVAPEESAVFAAGEEESISCARSEEHTSELQSPDHIVCRLLL